jgi:hypothetical protein
MLDYLPSTITIASTTDHNASLQFIYYGVYCNCGSSRTRGYYGLEPYCVRNPVICAICATPSYPPFPSYTTSSINAAVPAQYK